MWHIPTDWTIYDQDISVVIIPIAILNVFNQNVTYSNRLDLVLVDYLLSGYTCGDYPYCYWNDQNVTFKVKWFACRRLNFSQFWDQKVKHNMTFAHAPLLPKHTLIC